MSLKVNEENIPYIDLGGGYKVCLQDAACAHGEDFEKKARLKINETPENLKRGLEEMRRLIAADPELCVPSDGDWYLKLYLRAAHYDAQEACSILQANSKLKLKNPEYFTSSATLKHVFEEGMVWILPERNHDGSVIIVIESGSRWNPAKVSIVELNAAVNAVIAVLASSEEAQLHGCILLFDVEGLSMSHIMQCTPKSTGIMLTLIEKCSPIRILTTQTINTGLIYNFLFAIIKPLQTKRMREMSILHGKNLAPLGKYISPEILPARFGGTSKAPLCEGRLFAELMMLYDPWMEKSFLPYGYTRKNSISS
ncbi:alpha-tocopherol transfer protein-like isoform X2 [Ochlerotatus camptorhynchus]|uniref:alpha-tocopherol transfer protein-like isoform X2 n=1 Tax=Ochlerotatus camptorhynchus TaxID=644619 RepID=UPI0031DC1649